MSKHTPGPWSIPHFADPEIGCHCGHVLVEGFMGAVATVHYSQNRDLDNGDNPPFEECAANARLIAAAPDLLEALKRCREMAIDFGAPVDCWSEMDTEILQYIDATIAKAEGGAA